MEHIWNRVATLRRTLVEKDLDALLLLNMEGHGWVNTYYYSGFRGTSSVVIITADKALLSTDSRYTSQAQDQSPFEQLVSPNGEPLEAIGWQILQRLGVKRCGFDGGALSASTYIKISELPVEWHDMTSAIAVQRRKKDAHEVALIRRAAEIAGTSYLEALKSVRPGMKEIEFAKIVELQIARNGGEGVWHDSPMIVASGVRSALPHGRAGTKTMELGEQVTIDWGSIYCAYLSDLTRNFTLGPVADKEFLHIHDVLLEAHRKSAAAIAPGVSCREVDAIARNIIADAGYGDYFGHGLGHSFGIDIHENPRFNTLSTSTLEVGDIMTIEPGIYIPGRGGMRIEDDYLVTADGHVHLSDSLPQELICLDL